ncbi:MAG TPA: hypothetical protein GX521_04915, partial [Firmicutes bacterium]|nr:hypothetical protein [Bacillota bacterium]
MRKHCCADQRGRIRIGSQTHQSYRERKKHLTKEEIKKNATETIRWLITNGALKIRTHTDSTEPNLMTLEALRLTSECLYVIRKGISLSWFCL